MRNQRNLRETKNADSLKKILLISDTHSHLDSKLEKYIHEADEVWHAGDIGDIEICKKIEATKPFKAVFGNIDNNELRSRYAENLIFNCEEVKVAITHIAASPGKYPTRVNKLLEENKPQIFICGHSHILKVMYDKTFEVLYMNPGACGVHGFHKVKTALRFEIDGKEIKNLAVIELGNRSTI